MPLSSILSRLLLAGIFAFPLPTNSPWDKPADQWNLADTYKILEDSPWSPTKVSLETKYTQRHTDALTSVVTDSPTNPQNTANVRGVELSRTKITPAFQVKWWSSKTIRMAELRMWALKSSGNSAIPAPRVEDLSDYVIAFEGDEPLRIFRDAKEDLHDTVFLELDNGFTLDLASVQFVDGADSQPLRTEFHFPRQVEGKPGIDVDTERVVFHCRATAKKQMPNRENSISIRVDFHPKEMRAHGEPDL